MISKELMSFTTYSNSQLSTLNFQFLTLNFQFLTLNFQLSTLNSQLYIVFFVLESE